MATSKPDNSTHITSHPGYADLKRVPQDDPRDTLHDGWEQLAVNNTRWRRLLVRLALKTTGRFYKRLGTCKPISRHLVVKSGRRVHLAEAATMQYVAAHTSIPVPKVYCAFVHKNRAYIVMERVRGQMLGKALPKMSPEQTDKVLAQLRSMVDELRALPPPSPGVANSGGGSLYDCRINRPGLIRFGPFKTIQEFHLWLREGEQMRAEKPPMATEEDWEQFKHMVKTQDGPFPSPVFTHADISGSNVMVRGDKVVGFIDWECSGWYPSYWEYTSSWYTALMRPKWQSEILPKIVDPCSADELKMEIARQRWHGF